MLTGDRAKSATVTNAEPRTLHGADVDVTSEEIADLEVRATFLEGRQVYAIQD